ncbi:IS1380 family transposase [bacterium CG_4_9_14_3_um_filter_65_15]|nr:MAG: IS1380 family transposase [bacterium CG_4_9_14_3_um_filter_65_15]
MRRLVILWYKRICKDLAIPQKEHAMGERISQPAFDFNRSVRLDVRPERVTSDAGALLIRETMDKLGIDRWLGRHLVDHRREDRVTHPWCELLRTKLILLCQGWRDNDDADFLRHDPALRLSVSDRRGDAALADTSLRSGGKNPSCPQGLASQPTLSRLVDAVAAPEDLPALHACLVEAAGRRIRSTNGGRRVATLTVDVDSLPAAVHGHQPGSMYNGHYHDRIYHPLIATAGEQGDLLGGKLRSGNVHTADGAEAFILQMLDQVEAKICVQAHLRLDAGFPSEPLLAALEARRTRYTCRIRKNAVLDRMAQPYLKRPVGRPPCEPRLWFHELQYQADGWSRPRRVVLIVQEKPDELFLHHFWLVTNWPVEQIDGPALLGHYRRRGLAEAHFGELMNVLEPALSSSPRAKSHYRGRAASAE